jgi:phytoene synthase
LVQRLLAEATLLYQRGAAGISMLPLDCRVGIGAAGKIYAAIGDRLAGAGFDSINQRARVPGTQKLKLAGAAMIGALLPRAALEMPALAANVFLINAMPQMVPQTQPSSLMTLLNLFERLERDQRRAVSEPKEIAA